MDPESKDSAETQRRQQFLEDVAAAFASLRADATEWEDVVAERAAWDVTLLDGLTSR